MDDMDSGGFPPVNTGEGTPMSQSLPPGVSIPGSEAGADDAASVATGTTVTTGTGAGHGSGKRRNCLENHSALRL